MVLARRILFFIFSLAYLIICPLLILYSLGYIFVPAESEFVQTGVIYLSTTPPGADVYLEGSRFTFKTPTIIRELNPGKYKVTLRLKGYKPWAHTIEVEPGKASAFLKVLLIPKIWQVREISRDSYKELIPQEGTEYFLLSRDVTLGNNFTYDVKKDKIRLLLSLVSPFFEFPVSNIFKAKESPLIIVYGGSLWDKKYLFFDLKEPAGPKLKDISPLFRDKASFIIWEGENAKDIFVAQKDNIDRIDADAMAVYPDYMKDIKGFGIHNKWLYVIEKNGLITRRPYDKEEKQVLSEDPYLAKRFFRESDFYQIFILKENRLLFHGTKGALLINHAPYTLAERDIAGFRFYENQNILLFWTKESINMINFMENGNPSFKERIKVQTIYKKGRNIRQCFLIYGGSHIIFTDKEGLYLIELQPQGQHHIEHIVKTLANSEIFYYENTGCVYYLDNKNQRLETVQIIPQDIK